MLAKSLFCALKILCLFFAYIYIHKNLIYIYIYTIYIYTNLLNHDIFYIFGFGQTTLLRGGLQSFHDHLNGNILIHPGLKHVGEISMWVQTC